MLTEPCRSVFMQFGRWLAKNTLAAFRISLLRRSSLTSLRSAASSSRSADDSRPVRSPRSASSGRTQFRFPVNTQAGSDLSDREPGLLDQADSPFPQPLGRCGRHPGRRPQSVLGSVGCHDRGSGWVQARPDTCPLPLPLRVRAGSGRSCR